MNVTSLLETEIRTKACPACALCGSGGEPIHPNLKDRLFGASGRWDLKQCSNADCQLIWLDPMPLAEEIGKAYAQYYTHSGRPSDLQTGLLKKIYGWMKSGYWHHKYGYPIVEAPRWQKILGALLYLFPLRRAEADHEVRFLPRVAIGRVLDVGCGSGDWLLKMTQLGWVGEGVDFDQEAVDVARSRGLSVSCGSVEEQAFASNSFDAVTLNHVIEHVPEPVNTLIECHRILKPGGRLVICTPNSSSLGHRLFQQDWRGLEPPRHLHLFSLRSGARLLRAANFQKVSLYPQIALSVIYDSLQLRFGRTGPFKESQRGEFFWALARIFNLIEVPLSTCNASSADCFAAVAIKE